MDFAVQGRTFLGPCGVRRPSFQPAPGPGRHRRLLPCCASSLSNSRLAELRASLAEAVEEEKYQLAASLRDEIAVLESQDPLLIFKKELSKAVDEERFEDAAVLKAKIADIQECQNSGSNASGPMASSATSSEAVTEGIKVTAHSYFVEDASEPNQERFLFAYHITIRNESMRTVKLVERYWEITNDRGQMHHLRGEGVVGRQPELQPGQSFVYQATCPLSTPLGEMKGHYEMYVKNETSGQWTTSFLAAIAAFGLDSGVVARE